MKKVKHVLRALNRRRNLLNRVKDYDLVYVFREAALLGPAWFERRIAASGVPMIFDFDDAVFVKYKSPTNGYLSHLKFPGKTATTVRLSAHVMAGNSFLERYSRKYNQNVTVIPTTIDTDKYKPVEKAEAQNVVTIGWSGSHSTVQHLDTLRDTLQELAKNKNFRLRVIGTPEYELTGVKTESIRWRSETEVLDLKKIDIGIMPLPNDEWSMGKCGLKALQYMALGLPTVCSSIGVNKDIIRDAENGFLADSKNEWIDKLSRLLDSAQLRKTLGSKARATVEEKYSARSQAPRVYQLFKETIESRSLKTK
ncbi:MAG TPA: glycosyltransferase family 4 protein [Pyrinomonadaceae bacterium]|nr:glycosyltransferase family 4 protein [Pyrinomonadaceae bacterium]